MATGFSFPIRLFLPVLSCIHIFAALDALIRGLLRIRRDRPYVAEFLSAFDPAFEAQGVDPELTDSPLFRFLRNHPVSQHLHCLPSVCQGIA